MKLQRPATILDRNCRGRDSPQAVADPRRGARLRNTHDEPLRPERLAKQVVAFGPAAGFDVARAGIERRIPGFFRGNNL